MHSNGTGIRTKSIFNGFAINFGNYGSVMELQAIKFYTLLGFSFADLKSLNWPKVSDCNTDNKLNLWLTAPKGATPAN